MERYNANLKNSSKGPAMTFTTDRHWLVGNIVMPGSGNHVILILYLVGEKVTIILNMRL